LFAPWNEFSGHPALKLPLLLRGTFPFSVKFLLSLLLRFFHAFSRGNIWRAFPSLFLAGFVVSTLFATDL